MILYSPDKFSAERKQFYDVQNIKLNIFNDQSHFFRNSDLIRYGKEMVLLLKLNHAKQKKRVRMPQTGETGDTHAYLCICSAGKYIESKKELSIMEDRSKRHMDPNFWNSLKYSFLFFIWFMVWRDTNIY